MLYLILVIKEVKQPIKILGGLFMRIVNLSKSALLDGGNTLSYQVYRNTFEGKKSTSELIVDDKYFLNHCTEKQLLALRRQKTPTFILKFDGQLFYALVRQDFFITNHFIFSSKHQCDACTRCYAKPFEEGGCLKVLSRKSYLNVSEINTIALRSMSRIERFPFIVDGYETIGIQNESFYVANCQYFKG